jgi:hypothetical protein
LKASAAFVFPIYTRVFQHDGEEIADKGQVRGCKGYYSRKWVSLSLILIKDKCELGERIMGRDSGGTCRRKIDRIHPGTSNTRMLSSPDRDQTTNSRPKKTEATNCSRFESPVHVTQPQHDIRAASPCQELSINGWFSIEDRFSPSHHGQLPTMYS